MRKLNMVMVLVTFLINIESYGQKTIYYDLNGSATIFLNTASWTYTDTLAFNLPENSKVLIYYNNEQFSGDSIEMKLTPVLKRAKNFPKETTKIYRFNRNFSKAGIKGAINDINRLYSKNRYSVLIGIPLGVDLTGGDFAPIVGFRWALQSNKGFSYGLSFENQTFFEKSEGVLKSVDNNQFLNFELGFNPQGGMFANNDHVIQFGYLLKSQSTFYSGNTYKLAYRYTVKKWGSLQLIGGFMATDSFNKTFPFAGVRFF